MTIGASRRAYTSPQFWGFHKKVFPRLKQIVFEVGYFIVLKRKDALFFVTLKCFKARSENRKKIRSSSSNWPLATKRPIPLQNFKMSRLEKSLCFAGSSLWTLLFQIKTNIRRRKKSRKYKASIGYWQQVKIKTFSPYSMSEQISGFSFARR